METLLAIDQGTTSSRALLFNQQFEPLDQASKPIKSSYPNFGWVEQDGKAIFDSVLEVCRVVLDRSNALVSGVTLTNQRETTLVWDKDTFECVYPAIVWQDRRVADVCESYLAQGVEREVHAKTGLVIDPYFSALKIQWILNHVEGAKAKAQAGQLRFGTVDSYLIYCLTKGRSHVTDVTNASRTQLMNLQTLDWDPYLCELFEIPMDMLPTILANDANFGVVDEGYFGREMPICGVIGDQQGACLGQACLSAGDVKATYGTGGFVLMNTSTQAPISTHRLLTTPAYQVNGVTHFALEGSIFMAGSLVDWMKRLEWFEDPKQTQELARSAHQSEVVVVPAMSGLGAPFWDANVRGAMFGLDMDTTKAEIIRGGLESICFQTKVLFEAFAQDVGQAIKHCKIDGAMASNDWFVQTMADVLECDVLVASHLESTALGAALCGGFNLGWLNQLEDVTSLWQYQTSKSPNHDMSVAYQRWSSYVGSLSEKANRWYQTEQQKVAL